MPGARGSATNGTTAAGLVLRSFEVSVNPNMIVSLTSPGCPIVRVNAALEELLGLNRDDLIGRSCRDVLGLSDTGVDVDLHAPLDAVLTCRAGRREPFACRLEVRPVPDAEGAVTHSLCTLRDVSAQVSPRDVGATQASLDCFSGLVPDHVLEEGLAAELVRAVHACSRIIVCYLRIDRFDTLDEICDLDVATRLTRMIAERLVRCAGDPGRVSRTASGAFVAVFVGQDAAIDQLDVGQGIVAALEPPFVLGSMVRRVTASVGVSCFPDTASEVRELLRQAAAAAYAVRRAGGNDVHAYTATLDGDLGRQLELADELEGAVQRGEMELAYQPVLNAAKREVVGMEALVRWRSPRLGFLMPDQFIPFAESLGMIEEIGRWVLQEACAQARRWLDLGVGDFTLSVNVSRAQMRGRQLLEDVRRALDASRLQANFLDLELTETAIMANVEEATWTMRELRKMGVKLSMDDFGIGQSSLGHLQRLPVNRMKIDRSFVAAVPDDVNAARICRAIIGLAHEFGFSVVGEGVEKAVQLAFLERNGCEFVQGYLLSAPVSADAMLAMLREPVLYPRETNGKSRNGAVLLVDDEQNVLRALGRLLRRDGYRIFTASSFHDAFEILGTENVHVVMSDHRMPEGKGTEFLSRVKATHPHTIRLILSGYADLGAVTEAINGGAVYRFLTKPWNDDDLRETLREAMRMAQAAAGEA
jgi:EAL domain-containing protein (putative c-di-GMP-specific phosphodiesterase class I)/PleD family two-component response regulator